MIKRLIIFAIAVALVFGIVITSGATSLSDLNKQQSELKAKQKAASEKSNEVEASIKKNADEQYVVSAEIKAIDDKISQTSEKIRENDGKIEVLNGQNAELDAKIADLNEKMATRDELIRKRLVANQENGWNSSYFEVVLGAMSFSQFIERTNVISSLIRSDQEIFSEQEKDAQASKKAKDELEQAHSELEKVKAELLALESDLRSQKSEKEKIMERLEEEGALKAEESVSVEEERANLAEQARVIEKFIREEENRIAEERRKAEEEAKKSGNQPPPSSQTPAPISGLFMNPAQGWLSSGYGMRSGGMHYGIDIANSNRNVPIVAAASGVVTRSYYSSSYGNCLMIAHYVNGEIITTLYAHLELRYVYADEKVTKGQTIGVMGNTGNSFGQHLHFEMMKGEWQANHQNTFNPLRYVNY